MIHRYEVNCAECSDLIGYFHCTAPWGYILCPDCSDEELDKQMEENQ